MLMSHITKAAMEDMEPSGAPPLHHTVTPRPANTSTGDYDDLTELVS